MSGEDYADDSEEEEDDHDENLTDVERLKKEWLRRMTQRAAKRFSKGRKVDKGFEGAFASGENAHKFIRRHEFKFAAEPRDRVPESKPTSVSGEPWTEPTRHEPPKPYVTESKRDDEAEQRLEMMGKFYKILNDPALVDRLLRGEPLSTEKTIENDERRGQTGQDQAAIQEEKLEYNQKDIAAEVIATPRTASDLSSAITSGLEKEGYEKVSEIIEPIGEEDSLSELELGGIHEQLRRMEIEERTEQYGQESLESHEIESPRIEVEPVIESSPIVEPMVHEEILPDNISKPKRDIGAEAEGE